jgi:cytidylate kinase
MTKEVMMASTRLERCIDYLKCQSQTPRTATAVPTGGVRRMVTISRQAGTGAHVLAEEVVARLQARAPVGSCPWTVFDRNLVDKVLEDHDLPAQLARFMPEDRASELSNIMDGLFGLHPHSETLVRKTAETILHLAELGNVVVIGRGSNIVTAALEHALHVRLVGSMERRVERTQQERDLDAKAAAEYVRHEDLARQRYVRKYYRADIDDPLLYHVIINTDRMSHARAARMIADAVYQPDEPNEDAPIDIPAWSSAPA